MPVYGVPSASFADGGVAVSPRVRVAGRRSAGLPLLSWAGRHIETAFVLGGGGNRGAVQVGMLRALVERGILPDLVIGTSIGAVNATAFAGAPTMEGVELTAEVWRRIAAQDVFPRSRFHGSWRFLEKRESVFSMDGLRHIVESFIRFERLEQASVPVLLVTTRLEDAAEEWLTEGAAVDAVMASAALPGFYPAVQLGGAHYVDGGVLDNAALSAAFAARAKRVFLLLCGRVDAPSPQFSRPYEALFGAFTIGLQARLRRDLAMVPHDVDVVVFEQPGPAMFDPRDFSHTDELIASGYRVARDVLEAYLPVGRAASSRSRWRVRK